MSRRRLAQSHYAALEVNMANDGDEHSQFGEPIYRHEPGAARSRPVAASQSAELISQHIATHIGEVSSVFHEIVSDLVHIDINIVDPSLTRPFYTLITSGMSDRPMRAPKGFQLMTRAELMLCLPADWPMGQKAFKSDSNYWPLRVLKELARLPHEYSTWLWAAHTVPNGDPPKRYSNKTRLCCALLSSPQLTPESFSHVEAGLGKVIYFHSVVPIYREEMDFKLAEGVDALEERLREANVTELLDLKRVNVCKRKLLGGL
jgi:hypothetical protein